MSASFWASVVYGSLGTWVLFMFWYTYRRPPSEQPPPSAEDLRLAELVAEELAAWESSGYLSSAVAEAMAEADQARAAAARSRHIEKMMNCRYTCASCGQERRGACGPCSREREELRC